MQARKSCVLTSGGLPPLASSASLFTICRTLGDMPVFLQQQTSAISHPQCGINDVLEAHPSPLSSLLASSS